MDVGELRNVGFQLLLLGSVPFFVEQGSGTDLRVLSDYSKAKVQICAITVDEACSSPLSELNRFRQRLIQHKRSPNISIFIAHMCRCSSPAPASKRLMSSRACD